jgi:hypothetical protein
MKIKGWRPAFFFVNLWRCMDREWGRVALVDIEISWNNDDLLVGGAIMITILGFAFGVSARRIR